MPQSLKFIEYFCETGVLINNKPELIEGTVGKGKIIWSGFNLPFHIVDNNNYEEAKLLKNIILSLVPQAKPQESTFEVKRPTPENITVSGNNFRGIYFKENFDDGWGAKSASKELKVYRAGLDFMYIPTTNNSDKVDIIYKGNVKNYLVFYLSVFSSIAALIYIAFPKIFSNVPRKIIYSIKIKFLRGLARLLPDE